MSGGGGAGSHSVRCQADLADQRRADRDCGVAGPWAGPGSPSAVPACQGDAAAGPARQGPQAPGCPRMPFQRVGSTIRSRRSCRSAPWEIVDSAPFRCVRRRHPADCGASPSRLRPLPPVGPCQQRRQLGALVVGQVRYRLGEHFKRCCRSPGYPFGAVQGKPFGLPVALGVSGSSVRVFGLAGASTGASGRGVGCKSCICNTYVRAIAAFQAGC